jgi:c-di-GMP phosphodiesterase
LRNRVGLNLSTKIIGTFFIAALFCFLFVIYSVDKIFQSTSLESEKSKALILLDNTAADISMSLYLGLHDEASAKAKELFRNKEALAVKLTLTDGKLISKLDRANTTQEAMADSIKISKDVVDNVTNKAVAKIELNYSNDNYKNLIEKFRVAIYKIALISTIILIMVLGFVKYLLQPLGVIATKMGLYRPGTTVKFDIVENKNEIGRIVSSFNKMQVNINDYSSQLANINQNLEQKVEEKTAELRHNYYHDGMTGLPKRVKLIEDLKLSNSSLLLLNIDDFKEINDFYGYSVGDEILIGVGKWLTDSGYKTYRLSGDEFGVLFDSDVEIESLKSKAEELLNSLHNAQIPYGENERLQVSATCGVCNEVEAILNKADIALHHAKQLKKRVGAYSKELNIEEQYEYNMSMAALIKDAIEHDRVIVYYQPIADTKSQEITKYETLVRIIDKTGRLLQPIEFLSIAQKSRLYPELTKKVVSLACRDFRDRPESVSINISVTDILDPITVKTILNNIRECGIGDRIVFELLESEGIENIEEVTGFINEVKEMGVKIAIDDFGTGYSNFENILKLNVDFLKIDGSLIKNINENKNAKAIVETIVSFSQKLGISVVAEYVCDKEVFDAVKELGIQNSQGYYIGKPSALAARTD